MSAMFFTLTRVTPGRPISVGENPKIHQSVINLRLHRLGLTDEQGNSYPIPQQYVLYLGALLHGDLGDSYVNHEKVTTLLLQRLPNSILLLITLVAIAIPQIVNGAIITEGIFSWPGTGQLAFQAVVDRDYPVILGVVMLVAAGTVLFNLIADVTYAVADPRIRY